MLRTAKKMTHLVESDKPDKGDGRICYRGANKDCGGQVVVWDAAPPVLPGSETGKH
jgi:hypothetical protein